MSFLSAFKATVIFPQATIFSDENLDAFQISIV